MQGVCDQFQLCLVDHAVNDPDTSDTSARFPQRCLGYECEVQIQTHLLWTLQRGHAGAKKSDNGDVFELERASLYQVAYRTVLPFLRGVILDEAFERARHSAQRVKWYFKVLRSVK